jgi:hypothetical protein
MTTTVLERPISKKVIEELDLPTEWLGYDVEMKIIDEHKKMNESKLDMEDIKNRLNKVIPKIPRYHLEADEDGTLIIPRDAPDDVKEWMEYDY